MEKIYILEDIKLLPEEIMKIPTGLKCYFEKDEVLLLVIRSSMGFKHNIRHEQKDEQARNKLYNGLLGTRTASLN